MISDYMFSNGKIPVIQSLQQTGPELAGGAAPPLRLHGDSLPKTNIFCESQNLLLLLNM
jgi:hypothetical protein